MFKLKETAEAHLGQSIYNVVITIPPSYSFRQRQGIRDAATIAGLTASLLSVTDAAALAYNHLKRPQGERNVMVIDIGATTTNVSLLTFEADILEVKASADDLSLGGEDFDDRLVGHFVQEFRNRSGRGLHHFCGLWQPA